jgi:hypothetical protein
MWRKYLRVLLLLLTLLLVLFSAVPIAAQPPAPLSDIADASRPATNAALHQVARDTWQSFVVMTDPDTGLTADNIDVDGVRSAYTSPTNIGSYIWSTIAARDMGIIHPNEARTRGAQTLTALADMPRHEESGQFYNWYDPATGDVLTTWPENGNPVYPFLSTVDNGWLAAALMMVESTMPQLRGHAEAIESTMDFSFYYDPDPYQRQMRGGYWTELPPNQVYAPGVSGGCTNAPGTAPTSTAGWTCHHYGTLNTEPRIASYIAIGTGQVEAIHYYSMFRTFIDHCDWSWPEMQPVGEYRTYMGIDVYEGAYTYKGMHIVPSWGGSMFEALMPNLLVPEAAWGPKSWGVNHPLYVRAQILHGLEEAQYGYWGFSPASKPEGGYNVYGVDAIGMEPNGYPSNNDNTLVDFGFDSCPGRETQSIPPPEAYTNGVVTPHAAFLALEFARNEALANLAKLAENYDVYGQWGFYDSVNVETGVVAKRYLALDQGMIMAAIANDQPGSRFRNYFASHIQAAVQPLLAAEEFSAGQ